MSHTCSICGMESEDADLRECSIPDCRELICKNCSKQLGHLGQYCSRHTIGKWWEDLAYRLGADDVYSTGNMGEMILDVCSLELIPEEDWEATADEVNDSLETALRESLPDEHFHESAVQTRVLGDRAKTALTMQFGNLDPRDLPALTRAIVRAAENWAQ